MTTHSAKAWEFFRKFGEKPLILAPMAEVNDLAFRILCRNHGVKLCYTGMLNAQQWIQGWKYQNRVFTTSEDDKPCIAQIAGADYDAILSSARDLQEHADAIDINLGCTQHIAKRGEYGFFMVDTQEKRDMVLKLFKRLATELKVPVTAKIRIFQTEDGAPDEELTIAFAKGLEAAGVSVLAVHGRFQHRDKQADVSTAIIKRVVDSVSIPVIANGGVKSKEDAEALFEATGAAGVMIGQALLRDATLFDPTGPKPRKEFALEYLNIVKRFNDYNSFCPRKHMFLFFEDVIKQMPEIAEQIKQTETVDDLITFVTQQQ